jgi:hypothetical protein
MCRLHGFAANNLLLPSDWLDYSPKGDVRRQVTCDYYVSNDSERAFPDAETNTSSTIFHIFENRWLLSDACYAWSDPKAYVFFLFVSRHQHIALQRE